MAGGYDYHTALHNGLLMDKAIIFLYNIVLGNGNNSFFVQKVLSNLLYILQTDPPHPAERWGGVTIVIPTLHELPLRIVRGKRGDRLCQKQEVME